MGGPVSAEVLRDDLRDVFEHAGVGMAFVALDGRFTRVNARFAAMLGYTVEELTRVGPADLAQGLDVAAWLERQRPLVDGVKSEVVSEKRYSRRDGSAVWVSVVTTLMRDAAGEPLHFLSIVQDLSARERVEAALRESEEKFRQLAENIPEIFWITDVRQRELHYLSPGFETLTGMRVDAVVKQPRNWLQVVHVDDRERVRLARKALPEAQFDVEYRVVRPDGSIRWVHDQAFPVSDEHGNVYRIAGIGADVTHHKEAEAKLIYLAHYDGLTALPNRVLFFDRLRQAVAHSGRNGRSAAVMFLDVDRFKSVNDTLGHAIGDEVLKGVAQRLLACVRTGDTVARFSGDEFVLIVNDLHGPEDARQIAQKVVHAFSQPFRIDGHEIFVSTSMGISMYPADSEDEQGLIKHADTAMYRAKESGRNNFQFYTPEMNARARPALILGR